MGPFKPAARGGREYVSKCYESLERLIGISHKHWNHGKINGGQKRHYPFRHPKWRYPYLEGLSTRLSHSLSDSSSLLEQATAT